MLSRDKKNWILSQLEPRAAEAKSSLAVTAEISMAISLKRIADALSSNKPIPQFSLHQ